jgi:hypothetical protein
MTEPSAEIETAIDRNSSARCDRRELADRAWRVRQAQTDVRQAKERATAAEEMLATYGAEVRRLASVVGGDIWVAAQHGRLRNPPDALKALTAMVSAVEAAFTEVAAAKAERRPRHSNRPSPPRRRPGRSAARSWPRLSWRRIRITVVPAAMRWLMPSMP